MQEPFRNKKSRGYRLRPATGRDRLDSRVRWLCGRLGILAVVVAAAIVIRSLYNIQIVHGAEYRQYAAQQQLLDTTIKATRGEIYDASGITLASTSVVWTIWADPSYSSILYTSKTNDDDTVTKTLDPAMCAEVSRELTLRLLSGDGESLDSVDTSSAEYQQQYQTVYDALSRLDSAYVTLATKVNNAVKLSIEKYVTSFNKTHKKATDTSRKGRISVSSEKSFQRNYPYGAFAAAVLGFTDADGVGTYGLEKSYQSTLAGVDGRTITQRNAVGNAIADANATTFAAKDGSNLVLSLDVNVQEIAERYLNEAIAANTVENRGCAIVMDVKTGAILAMASKPDFDPNDPLNCGIEVNAQPPGKKLQLLSLLSGGERALTAIAILFAMLKLKPTPFCILDEIEAALDDANIGYYADYLKEYSKGTQFIVVTHRKGTMERCNSLFGVAMEEQGVSRMVSVSLQDYQE